MGRTKRYKRYSPEFKRDALKRASEDGVTDLLVCEELGISARHYSKELTHLVQGETHDQRNAKQAKNSRHVGGWPKRFYRRIRASAEGLPCPRLRAAK